MSHHIDIPSKFRTLVEASSKGTQCADDCAQVVSTVTKTAGIAYELCCLIDCLAVDNRPTLLLHEGDLENAVPTVWLLGWSRNERTGIHDHGDSEGAIAVIRGIVEDITYTCEPRLNMRDCAKKYLPVNATVRRYLEGSVMTLPYVFTHDMYGRAASTLHRDITVHAYWPPLVEMGYFEERSEKQRLRARQTGIWRKKPDEQRKTTPIST